jgi:hypothetical protein
LPPDSGGIRVANLVLPQLRWAQQRPQNTPKLDDREGPLLHLLRRRDYNGLPMGWDRSFV